MTGMFFYWLFPSVFFHFILKLASVCNSIFVYIFRIVIIVNDMKILQSADDTGGIIGSPTPYKRGGMAPLCACFKQEKIISHFWQSLVLFVYFTGKMSPAQEGPSSTTSVPDSPPGDSKPGPSQRHNSEFQLLLQGRGNDLLVYSVCVFPTWHQTGGSLFPLYFCRHFIEPTK